MKPLRTVRLNQKDVEKMFAESKHQKDIIWYLYQQAIDVPISEVRFLLEYPVISEETSDWLFDKFMWFDRKHHPDVIAGGAWMNNGFSIFKDSVLDFLEVGMLERDEIIMKGQKDPLKAVTMYGGGAIPDVWVSFKRSRDHRSYHPSEMLLNWLVSMMPNPKIYDLREK